MEYSAKTIIPVSILSILLISFSVNFASAEPVPEWVKNTALWYGEGIISEAEFLNMIKFLIENNVIVIETLEKQVPKILNAEIFIPNGNFDVTGAGFYSPLNLEIPAGTTVTWINDDSVPHNIQSIGEKGKVIQLFNSPPMNTGDKFEFTFEESGVYNYFCSFHPWRVGIVTVS
ncbi:MAG: plastocyanin/azurin family copper-binding protein [Nitrosopumilus sp.]|uniref:cupredoxin domain-containing protein n=1 Tax=Nitrosopumilus sp. TaxID=2024843 RepID=UPI00246FA5A0|nr:plastocyanin/azurin family copper-binding protein [Nitrosopumilus sp.]MDH5431387.1 plastocyanin/azurin family copper-binding protein [Nitrosopumilus sp.]MDH5664856.1 plastocyanin/azurin family copper-binding protein [Nitrosopumilus sp.]MDH5697255.1 plastocyanin/azurin family copper-binding protein [Nitrosopumilus sp.]